MVEGKTAVIGCVARTSMTLALTDSYGHLRPETTRHYDSATHYTLSAAFTAFSKESGLARLPQRCGIAVAGVPRGDTISVTSSRLFVSRSSLATMFDQALVINDFAANVWAVAATDPAAVQAAGAAAPGSGPGTFLVIGMELGLGVAAFIRDAAGQVTVLPTEAGHAELVDSAPEIAPLVEIIRRSNGHCTAETLLASEGMAAIANAIAEHQGNATRYGSAEDVISAASRGDCDARKATVLFAKALWRYAGNLALIFGAWDGLFLTGRIVHALRSTLALPEVRQGYVIPGPFANLLSSVPAGFLLIEHSELRGVAEALRRLP